MEVLTRIETEENAGTVRISIIGVKVKFYKIYVIEVKIYNSQTPEEFIFTSGEERTLDSCSEIHRV
jgi:hypothetical protein